MRRRGRFRLLCSCPAAPRRRWPSRRALRFFHPRLCPISTPVKDSRLWAGFMPSHSPARVPHDKFRDDRFPVRIPAEDTHGAVRVGAPDRRQMVPHPRHVQGQLYEELWQNGNRSTKRARSIRERAFFIRPCDTENSEFEYHAKNLHQKIQGDKTMLRPLYLHICMQVLPNSHRGDRTQT